MLYQTHVRVHLGNIHANLSEIRRRVGTERRIMLAVKADAYGHGAVEVASMVQSTGVADAFGVATLGEALELREAGITLPILRLSPGFATEATAAVEHDIALTVCDRSHVDAIQAACVLTGNRAGVHLKVDTGMGRVGCTPDEAVPLAEYITSQCPNLRLDGVFTHLAQSDLPAGDAETRRQLESFESAVRRIEGAIGHSVDYVHAANSGGILAHPTSYLTMVRPGIMAYGYYPDANTPRTVRLTPGLSWRSRISFLKAVAAGTPIGYAGTYRTPRATWIATVPVGYGDGFRRALSNRGEVLIRGRRYPVVGRVSMDQITVDLGPDAAVRVGDEVILIGTSGDERIGADDIAATLDTISYEVLTGIGPRVPRYYNRVPAASNAAPATEGATGTADVAAASTEAAAGSLIDTESSAAGAEAATAESAPESTAEPTAGPTDGQQGVEHAVAGETARD